MRRWLAWTASIAATSAAFMATDTMALASPSPAPGTATEVAGCATMTAIGGCAFTFQFVDAAGVPVAGLGVTFSGRGVRDCDINPTKQTTDSNGEATTGVNCNGTGTGTETLTAKGSNKVSGSVTITIT